MRQMKNSLFTRIAFCLLAGLLGLSLLCPMSVLARVEVGLDDGSGSEGDPLDSNDFGSGDGDDDSDLQDYYNVPPDEGILDGIKTFLMIKGRVLPVPFIHGGVPTIHFLSIHGADRAAVTHAD
ncbi:MAG: hypothetical protein KOO60_12820 [Gemmatimonadales bacterium]|nr:hypothetical protein [Gemmatimonadales bacterium]